MFQAPFREHDSFLTQTQRIHCKVKPYLNKATTPLERTTHLQLETTNPKWLVTPLNFSPIFCTYSIVGIKYNPRQPFVSSILIIFFIFNTSTPYPRCQLWIPLIRFDPTLLLLLFILMLFLQISFIPCKLQHFQHLNLDHGSQFY